MPLRYVADLKPPSDGVLASEGWLQLDAEDSESFDTVLKPLLVRPAGEGQAEAWIETGTLTRNITGGLHGGFLASVAEQTLFLPLFTGGRITRGGVVTIDFTVQYLAGGAVDMPIIAHVELLRETGRLAFVRGRLVQNAISITAYTGTLRKLTRRS